VHRLSSILEVLACAAKCEAERQNQSKVCKILVRKRSFGHERGIRCGRSKGKSLYLLHVEGGRTRLPHYVLVLLVQRVQGHVIARHA
jgi:hypothetical protein